VWIVGQVSGSVTTFASDSSTSSGNTLNAYDGETGRLLFQVRASSSRLSARSPPWIA